MSTPQPPAESGPGSSYAQPAQSASDHGSVVHGPSGYGAPGYGPQGYAPVAYAGPPPSPFGRPGGPQLAGWGARVLANILDSLIVLGVMVPFVVLGAMLSSNNAGISTLLIVLGYAAAVAFFVWQLVVQGRTGQTIGKRTMQIRLLREQDGQVIGAGLSIGRYFVHVLDAIPCYLGYLWPIWDDKKQTFADKILNTVVIKA